MDRKGTDLETQSRETRRTWGLLAAGFLLAVTGAQGQAAPAVELVSEPHWQVVCTAAKAAQLPPEAARLAAQVQPLPDADRKSTDAVDGCDEKAAYYGYSGRPDYAAAVACGYKQRRFPGETTGDPFQGPGVLSMLYANGLGVPRDLPLAIRFACENGWAAPAEMEYRIGHLEAMEKAGEVPGAKPFDLCDDGTSGLMMGACEDVTQGQAEAQRSRTLAGLRTRLPQAAQAMLPELQQAELAFEKARDGNEIDMSGTAREAFYLEDQGKLRDQFVINLQRFAKGDVPPVSTDDRIKAGRELGVAYDAVQKAPAATWADGTVKPEGVAIAERAWQQLFAAWLRFVPVAYPQLSKDAAATELLRLRTHQLRSLVSRQ